MRRTGPTPRWAPLQLAGPPSQHQLAATSKDGTNSATSIGSAATTTGAPSPVNNGGVVKAVRPRTAPAAPGLSIVGTSSGPSPPSSPPRVPVKYILPPPVVVARKPPAAPISEALTAVSLSARHRASVATISAEQPPAPTPMPEPPVSPPTSPPPALPFSPIKRPSTDHSAATPRSLAGTPIRSRPTTPTQSRPQSARQLPQQPPAAVAPPEERDLTGWANDNAADANQVSADFAFDIEGVVQVNDDDGIALETATTHPPSNTAMKEDVPPPPPELVSDGLAPPPPPPPSPPPASASLPRSPTTSPSPPPAGSLSPKPSIGLLQQQGSQRGSFRGALDAVAAIARSKRVAGSAHRLLADVDSPTEAPPGDDAKPAEAVLSVSAKRRWARLNVLVGSSGPGSNTTIGDIIQDRKQALAAGDDETLYSLDVLARRRLLQLSPTIVEDILRYWTLASHAQKDVPRQEAERALSKDAYVLLFRKIALALTPEASHQAVLAAIDADWERDSKGSDSVSRSVFHSSLFQLVDMWCPVVDGAQYEKFLKCLLHAIAVFDPRAGIVYRKDADITTLNTEALPTEAPALETKELTEDAPRSRRGSLTVKSEQKKLLASSRWSETRLKRSVSPYRETVDPTYVATLHLDEPHFRSAFAPFRSDGRGSPPRPSSASRRPSNPTSRPQRRPSRPYPATSRAPVARVQAHLGRFVPECTTTGDMNLNNLVAVRSPGGDTWVDATPVKHPSVLAGQYWNHNVTLRAAPSVTTHGSMSPYAFGVSRLVKTERPRSAAPGFALW